MTSELDELYLEWLSKLVCSKERRYDGLLRQLFHKEFVWIIANDDNRAEDGKEIRREFLAAEDLGGNSDFLEIGCSVLELLIGLARRLVFEAEGELCDWFWRMIKNLGLHKYTDNSSYSADRVDDILDRLIWRTYEENGWGGLFPLIHPDVDQRGVELWYQKDAYLLENGAY